MNTLNLLKELFGSKTVWGVIILLLNNTVLKETPLDSVMGDEAFALMQGVLNLIGGLVAFWGRITAKGPMVQGATPATAAAIPPAPAPKA